MNEEIAAAMRQTYQLMGEAILKDERWMASFLADILGNRYPGIGAKSLQRGIPVAGRLRRKNARLGVVEIGGINHNSEQIAHHIDDNMSFASFCFFPRQCRAHHLPPRF